MARQPIPAKACVVVSMNVGDPHHLQALDHLISLSPIFSLQLPICALSTVHEHAAMIKEVEIDACHIAILGGYSCSCAEENNFQAVSPKPLNELCTTISPHSFLFPSGAFYKAIYSAT